jgi:hypothetical protein
VLSFLIPFFLSLSSSPSHWTIIPTFAHVSLWTERCVLRLSLFLSSPSPIPVPLFQSIANSSSLKMEAECSFKM